MGTGFHTLGGLLPDLDGARLEHEDSRRLLKACLKHHAFEVTGLLRIETVDAQGSRHIIDGIVVECCDGTVPSRNPTGIKPRERLALLHEPGQAHSA
ncbi:hypothetical protein [Caballeronia sp. LZ001]|uniref:hypothetical protein n=1 Tax=Caballeronia sp. LZ001 TaxID=3038553 RepID=UPI00285D699E|nr:hypothetical protein [Caballeronia sp. LZ001]MDR5804971.1 hypothetical protein [Caballeronia sp. LZ001]